MGAGWMGGAASAAPWAVVDGTGGGEWMAGVRPVRRLERGWLAEHEQAASGSSKGESVTNGRRWRRQQQRGRRHGGGRKQQHTTKAAAACGVVLVAAADAPID